MCMAAAVAANDLLSDETRAGALVHLQRLANSTANDEAWPFWYTAWDERGEKEYIDPRWTILDTRTYFGL